MKKILLSLSVITFTLASLAAGGTGAFFSDTETSSGNTFTAGAIDLKIDNTSYYNGAVSSSTSWSLTDLTIQRFFDFLDIKPGDFGEDTISLHVDNNDSYVCADVKLTSNDDNGLNEPEALVDQTDGPGNGELADNMNFIWWADDGDNVLETGEQVISEGPIGGIGPVGSSVTVALADSQTNIWATSTPGPLPGDSTRYIGKAWCFGDITPAPLNQDGLGVESPTTPSNSNGGIICDGSLLDNSTQTDSLTADVSFTAVQSRHNNNFLCVPERPPEFGECSIAQKYADAAGVFDQGTQKSGAAVLANRSVPAAAFGAPQTSGAASDVGFPAGSFVSLGFKGAGPTHGSLILDFSDNVVLDEVGADLKVYEVTGGVYPDEKIKVEVSQNGSDWFVASSTSTRDAEIDIAPAGLAWARYVRVTDISTVGLFPNDADAYDLDAIEALHCGVPTNLQLPQ